MILALNLILAVVGLIGSVVAIGGDTWRKDKVAWRKRVTFRGWVAITCLLLAFAAGIAKEIISDQHSQAREVARVTHEQKVLEKFTQVETLLV